MRRSQEGFGPTLRIFQSLKPTVARFLPDTMIRWQYIFSAFADHHIKPEDKPLYFENVKRNLLPDGRLVVGDEFLPPHDPNDRNAWEGALKTYHGHIIEID